MIELNKDNFEEVVLNSKEPILVDFWSPTCTSCMALMPHIEDLEKTHGDNLKFASLDTSGARRLAISQKVMGLPVIAIYKDGKNIESLVSHDATASAVEALIQKYI